MLCQTPFEAAVKELCKVNCLIKPQKLNKGDMIATVSPSLGINCKNTHQAGYNILPA